jgi:hypothetical protein
MLFERVSTQTLNRMTDFTADWPEGADGDVFRRLAAAGFEFTKAWPVEYNVDFESWPPPEAALEQLRALYGEVLLYPPDEEGGGYVLFQVVGPLTYEGVSRNAAVRRGVRVMGCDALMRLNYSSKPTPLRGAA